ncbi:hypothetical protein GECvBMG_gp242c [Salmonella phage GEC_vB_MG]|uniref:Uncharacterized protein 203 n=1 Tax=Salmonella phage PVPSE1 TaxID=889338 RepID=G3BM69_9CAUD|nr:hypothetical protein PVP-SE1_gp203 [Salmonella phage PVPSE1]ADP02599.1 hypothetical protein [Salmonella phage PVPSE1]QPI14786.1 hypothetical protein GECvBMG_gp242c [Salmonella phage GEC_vB_MG]
MKFEMVFEMVFPHSRVVNPFYCDLRFWKVQQLIPNPTHAT